MYVRSNSLITLDLQGAVQGNKIIDSRNFAFTKDSFLIKLLKNYYKIVSDEVEINVSKDPYYNKDIVSIDERRTVDDITVFETFKILFN